MVTREVSSDNWKYSDGWTSNDIPFTDITAATVDPYGQLLLIGSADGRFNFICVGTGLLLPYHSRCMVWGFENDDRSRIQAISCALFPYNISRDRYRLLCAFGTSSGLFQFLLQIRRERERENDEVNRRYNGEALKKCKRCISLLDMPYYPVCIRDIPILVDCIRPILIR
ncbi:hypothetical protein D915_005689 [Fasciola hepatica]|uniref:Uncharacterized protein n=1 Tax=Fasciola hepatica TaxID=6192 RepID=A0A4E0R5C6_FASHE|nr:hypothetical protein D915_005689 [Fasciola hepatica]